MNPLFNFYRKLEYFKDKDVSEDLAKVRYEYWQRRRKTKLVQIENGLKGKSGFNPFMSLGINTSAVEGISKLSSSLKKASKPDKFIIENRHVSRLIDSLSTKSDHITPSLQ
jgi:hypothetical protein